MPEFVYPDRARFEKLAFGGKAVFVSREMIADCLTPVGLFSRIYHQRREEKRRSVFLFESREEAHTWGRYTYLGLGAARKVIVHKRTIDVVYPNEHNRIETIEHHGRPLDSLRELSRSLCPVPIPELADVPCGLVGYVTYEMVNLFDAVPTHTPEESDPVLAFFVVPDEMIVFDHLRQRLHLCVLSLDESGHTLPGLRYDTALAKLDELASELKNSAASEPHVNKATEQRITLKPVLMPEEFEQKIEQAKLEIVRGEIIQIVLSQPFVSHTVPDPVLLYRAQRLINPSPYLFFLHFDDTILVGSSPETMVRLHGDRALIRPIAGTRPRGLTAEEDRRMADELLSDEKERAEHLMLVDLGRNDLGRVARTGTVCVDNLMYVQRYSHVMHLVSDVTAELEETRDAFDLFQATFPAGTLTGAPKIRAMQLIHQYEDRPRSCYGGAVGYFSFNGDMDFAITIRTAMIHNGLLTVQAGAGVVYDSVPERERLETINKAKALIQATELIELLDHQNI